MTKYRTVGIPLKEVGQRLQELNDAISQHDMAKCVTMTVYFFSKDE